MPSNGMVKLTNEDIKWLIIFVISRFFKVKKTAQIYGAPKRRVQQLLNMYHDTGKNQKLNPKRWQIADSFNFRD